MAGGFLKPGCLKPGLWLSVLDVCLGWLSGGCVCLFVCLDVCWGGFGCLSGILGFLEPGMRADLSIYLLPGVIQICVWVICGLLCVFVDCVFGSCGAQFANVIAALRRTGVLERFGAFPRC